MRISKATNRDNRHYLSVSCPHLQLDCSQQQADWLLGPSLSTAGSAYSLRAQPPPALQQQQATTISVSKRT